MYLAGMISRGRTILATKARATGASISEPGRVRCVEVPSVITCGIGTNRRR